MITGDTLVEDLVRDHPPAVSFLLRRGLVCIACGAPVWGTLAELAQRSGYGETEIEQLVAELSDLPVGREG